MLTEFRFRLRVIGMSYRLSVIVFTLVCLLLFVGCSPNTLLDDPEDISAVEGEDRDEAHSDVVSDAHLGRWLGLYNGFGNQGYMLAIASSDSRSADWTLDDMHSPIQRPSGTSVCSSPKALLCGKKYFMYATARSWDSHTYLWTSSNGVDWLLYSESPVLSYVAVGAVHYDPSNPEQPYKLWGLKKNTSGVTYYHSVDGIAWLEGAKVLEIGEPGSWDAKKITPQAIYLEADTWYLFYEGRDPHNFMQGGVAMAATPEGPYERSPDNPIIRREAHANQALGRNAAEGERSLDVADASVFSPGQPVVVFDATGRWEFNRIEAIPDPQTILVETPLRQPYATALRGSVRSWAWAKVYPTVVWKEGNVWKMICTCFDAYKDIYSGVCEATGLISGSSLSDLAWDYALSPVLPMGSSLDKDWDHASRENMSVVPNITWNSEESLP
jgi:hypothetical protein